MAALLLAGSAFTQDGEAVDESEPPVDALAPDAGSGEESSSTDASTSEEPTDETSEETTPAEETGEQPEPETAEPEPEPTESEPTEPETAEPDEGEETGNGTGAGALEPCSVLRLYEDADCTKVASGIMKYEPKYKLWSDGADKERYIYLPKDSTIDTTNPDRWHFPEGTRLYKTFLRGGKRMETRIIEKVAEGNWTLVTYAWAVELAPGKQPSVFLADEKGQKAPADPEHDIPSQGEGGACLTCHNFSGPDMEPVLGFSALSLNWTDAELEQRKKDAEAAGIEADTILILRDLIGAEQLETSKPESVVTFENAQIHGRNETETKALGYLHANCGNCHGDGEAPDAVRFWPPMKLWAKVGKKAEEQPALLEAVCKTTTAFRRNTPRIQPKDLANSAVYQRMLAEGYGNLQGLPPAESSIRMPPLATKLPDHEEGLKWIAEWIDTVNCLPPPAPTPTPAE